VDAIRARRPIRYESLWSGFSILDLGQHDRAPIADDIEGLPRRADDERSNRFRRGLRVVRPLWAVGFDDEHLVGADLVGPLGRLDVEGASEHVEQLLLVVVVVVGERYLLAGLDFVDVRGYLFEARRVADRPLDAGPVRCRRERVGRDSVVPHSPLSTPIHLKRRPVGRSRAARAQRQGLFP